MKNGGTLEMKTILENSDVIIDVSDTGEGIREDNLEKVFRPFYSTREGGLGLGLSIVQKIVESHGGTISCDSKPGTGTKFRITLPLERSQV